MELSPQVAGLVSTMVGLACGLYLVWSLARQQASKGWPTTKGEILQSRLDQDSDGWIPYVRFRYTVDEQVYTGDRIGFYTPNSSTEAYAKLQVSRYPAGKVVLVSYDPHKPKDAVLNTKIPWWLSICWLFLSLFFLVVGVQMWRGAVF